MIWCFMNNYLFVNVGICWVLFFNRQQRRHSKWMASCVTACVTASELTVSAWGHSRGELRRPRPVPRYESLLTTSLISWACVSHSQLCMCANASVSLFSPLSAASRAEGQKLANADRDFCDALNLRDQNPDPHAVSGPGWQVKELIIPVNQFQKSATVWHEEWWCRCHDKTAVISCHSNTGCICFLSSQWLRKSKFSTIAHRMNIWILSGQTQAAC